MLLWHVSMVVIYVILGLGLFAVAYLIIDKATRPEADAYSAFSGTTLAAMLRERGIERVLVGGLATDYCVLNTVRDALKEGFRVRLLKDAIRAVNVHPSDGASAEREMEALGAVPAVIDNIATG